MTVTEEREIIAKAQAGDEFAKSAIYEAYAPLIKHAAALANKRYRFELYEDALGAANLAFWRCVLNFSDDKGCFALKNVSNLG